MSDDLSKTSVEYLAKLNKALGLILKDVPDNQDDTINAKLLDSLKLSLQTNRYENLGQFVETFLLDEILQSSQFRSNLSQLDAENVRFFIDLVTIFIQNSPQNAAFQQSTVEFLSLYFAEYFHSQFLNESSICCSIIRLIRVIHDSDSNQSVNQLLGHFLFSDESLLIFLNSPNSSIFVRRDFISLFQQYLLQINEFDALKKIQFLAANLSIEAKIHSLDLQSNLIKQSLNNERKLSNLAGGFKFWEEREKYFENCVLIMNDSMAEAFAYVYNYAAVANHGASISTHFDQSVAFLFERLIDSNDLRKTADLFFKFVIYSLQFYRDFDGSDSVKKLLRDFLTLPMRMNYVENAAPNGSDSMLNRLNSKPFKLKLLLLKQCVANLQLFLKKFQFVDLESEHCVSLLRNLRISKEIKFALSKLLCDYFCLLIKQKQNVSKFEALFKLFANLIKSEEFYEVNMLKLTMLKIPASEERESQSLIDRDAKAPKRDPIRETEIDGYIDEFIDTCFTHSFKSDQNLEIFLIFLIDFLHDEIFSDETKKCLFQKLFNHENSEKSFLQELNRVLSSVGKFDHFLDEFEALNDLKYLIYRFYKSAINAGFMGANEWSSQEAFISLIEAKCLEETEAFVRREAIGFLASLSFLFISHYFKSQSKNDIFLLKKFQFFAHFLSDDFDWEIQLCCLDFFEKCLKLDFDAEFAFLVIRSNFPKSLLKCFDDYDQHVICKTCHLLNELKSNVKFNDCLIEIKEEKKFSENDVLKMGWDEESVERFLALLNRDNEIELKLKSNERTSDLYERSPVSILDDIISSYQFEINDEKFVDCY